MRGRFITFEGGEGTGKSTHAAQLAQRLTSLGIAAEALLFAAARDDHVRHTIEPALARGSWVVCDRFIDSTRVYQGALGHLDPKLIRALERVTVGDLRPDLTFILDVPAEVGLARAGKRRGDGAADRFEGESLAFHAELREAYRLLVVAEPRRCVDRKSTRLNSSH